MKLMLIGTIIVDVVLPLHKFSRITIRLFAYGHSQEEKIIEK